MERAHALERRQRPAHARRPRHADGRVDAPLLDSGGVLAPDRQARLRRRCACGCWARNLVLFRDTQGRIGLLDERCPHRTASLFYGRNEESGLRCVYHGLKFDVDGNCVDLPCVPQMTYNLQSAAVEGQVLPVRRARRRGVDLYGAARAQAGIPRARMDAAPGIAALRHPPHPGMQLAAGARRRLRRHPSHVSARRRRRRRAAASSRRSTKSCRRISVSWSAPAAIPATAASCGT